MFVAVLSLSLALTTSCINNTKSHEDTREQADAVCFEKEATDNKTGKEQTDVDKRSTQSATLSGLEIPQYESSRGGQIIRHLGYTVSYDADFKTPQWVGCSKSALFLCSIYP